jgi:hypothetical protein
VGWKREGVIQEGFLHIGWVVGKEMSPQSISFGWVLHGKAFSSENREDKGYLSTMAPFGNGPQVISSGLSDDFFCPLACGNSDLAAKFLPCCLPVIILLCIVKVAARLLHSSFHQGTALGEKGLQQDRTAAEVVSMSFWRERTSASIASIEKRCERG